VSDDLQLNRESDSAQRRENPEPEESGSPVPKILLTIVTGLVFWGAMYILFTQRDDAPNLGDRRTLAALSAKAAGTGGVDGAAIYAARCAACHQAAQRACRACFRRLRGRSGSTAVKRGSQGSYYTV
jgi:hypothetical protein